MNRSSVFPLCHTWTRAVTGAACVAILLPGCFWSRNPAKVYNPDDFTQAARYSLSHGLEMQAVNGEMLDHTLWNYHFEEDSEELRPSGRAFLDRFARNSSVTCSGYYLQSAHDIEFEPNEPETYFRRRDELNALRQKSAADYLARVAPGNTLVAQIHDRAPVSIPSDESGRAFILMSRKAPQGLLPPEITASRFSFGASSGDFGSSVGGGFGGLGDGGLPPALGGALPSDSSMPSFSSDVPTGPSADYGTPGPGM